MWKILLHVICEARRSKVLNIPVNLRPLEHVLTSNSTCFVQQS